MKLKPSEIAFVAVCLIAAAVSIAAVYISRERAVGGEIVIEQVEPSGDEEYDVSVINSASLEDFMNISGIGEVKAGDIISFREALGGFTRVSQIKAISGISDSLYQKSLNISIFRRKAAIARLRRVRRKMKQKKPLTIPCRPSRKRLLRPRLL